MPKAPLPAKYLERAIEPEKLAARFRAARIAAGFPTAAAAARAIGMHPSRLHSIENEKANITWRQLDYLTSQLNLDPRILLPGNDPEKG